MIRILLTNFILLFFINSSLNAQSSKSFEGKDLTKSTVKNNLPKESLGKSLFLKNNCIQCHGADQKGIGSNPALLGLEKKYKEEDIFLIIKKGKGGMPPNWELSDDEMKAIAKFLITENIPNKKIPRSIKK